MTKTLPGLTVLGAINLDLTARVRRAPEPGETVADGSLTRQPGGKGANQAIAAARLGSQVRLLGAVGHDSEGDELLQHLSDGRVDVSGVQRSHEATGTALIVVDASGENSIVVCAGANARIDADQLTIPPGEAVLCQLEVEEHVVMALAGRSTGFFALNASPARALADEVIERVDLFIVNEGEYAVLGEVPPAALVAVTLGPAGARLYRGGIEVASAPGVPTEVRNTVGAGDTFAAALTLGILRGDDLTVALRRACAVGAAAVADPYSQPMLSALDSYSP